MKRIERLKLAERSLKGVSIGDAFGESFFGERAQILTHISERTLPDTTWDFTDDTIMAIAVFEQLEKNSSINQDEFIQALSKKHNLDPYRGYGATVRTILRDVDQGKDWKNVSRAVFDGMGSMGNGAAMRVSPIGAYFFDDLDQTRALAIQSAEVTHSNIEGITGAIAVAVAAGLATRMKIENKTFSPEEFILKILEYLPDSDTKAKINKSLSIPLSYHIQTIRSILGNGEKILATDTVPFAIWCAAHHLNNFENALWKGVSILGDRDTIGAIIGGVTIMSSDDEHIPERWLNDVEHFEISMFRNTQKSDPKIDHK